jgi:drug/metabolite transporter (DMT)-like permease
VSRRRTALLWIALLALDVAIQVLMKLAGDTLESVPFGGEWMAMALSNWLVWISAIGYGATFVLWLAILRSSDLAVAFPLTASTYVLVPLSGYLFLGEALHANQVIGIALIVAGLLVQRDA